MSMNTLCKILILGGYGAFGGRLAQLLADEERLTLVIAGRSREKGEAFCASLQARALLMPMVFDRDGDLDAQLAAIAPDIVVDASGPFQTYDDPYKVIRAVLARGINYLDLADGSDFVKGVERFNAEATARGIFVLSGVSTCPVLTAAVVRRLGSSMARLDSVTAGIAPSPYARAGLNVIRAIASYAGKPIEIPQTGIHYPFLESISYTIAPPGHVPLKRKRFSLADVPDLKMLPALWPSLSSIWFGAGPTPAILHRTLNTLAWAVRIKLLPSLLPFASLMFRVINTVRWGEHRGGMFVSVRGLNASGQSVERSWHMIAEGDDGPLIPSMGAAVIIRHYLAGRRPPPGARAATRDLELTDYEAMFARRRIVTGLRQMMPPEMPIYRRILGEAWERLPEPLQSMHDVNGLITAQGEAMVERGRGLPARLIGAFMGFPKAGLNVPVTVTFTRKDNREVWQRNFAGRLFTSTQIEGEGRFEHLVYERAGPIAIGFALVVENGCLKMVPRAWTCFGFPMPLAWVPVRKAYECVENGRFCFHVEMGHPLVGLIVRYRGWLVLSTKA